MPDAGGHAAPPDACPGVVPGAQWDEGDALRGEIHTAERLSEHAVEVARAHGEPSLEVKPGPLQKRFADARERIEVAYDVLSRVLEKKREPSPAEEWLLDNSHIVEEQIREVDEDLPRSYLVELPRLRAGAMRGYPRVYGLCLDYLRHTDGRIDMPTLVSYVLAYQTVRPLTIGELWAIPIMLRVGLVLAVGALASSEVAERDRERADAWAKRVIENGHTPEKVSSVLARLEREGAPVTPPLLVELLRHMREHDAPLGTAGDWIAAQCAKMGTTPDELARKQHLRRAADQVSVGNAITSMRAIGALDWNAFFEQTSAVEELLRTDPSGHYASMDKDTRDRYRHTVERLARRAKTTERGVAEAALGLAKKRNEHVGVYLAGTGRRALERTIRYRPRFEELATRPILAHPAPFYFGAIVLFTVAACTIAALCGAPFAQTATLAVLVALFAFPASEMAVAIVNSVVVAVVPPRILPKMSHERGIPKDQRTLVVVPALLDRPETVRDLLEALELRSLANLDENLHFALLTDFPDHAEEAREDDATLLALAKDGVAELEARWEHAGAHRYMLLHRKRVYNTCERKWMGWERKRGKLEELNRLLRGDEETTYTVVTAPRELLESVRYVITLDADTELPRDTARRLVATMAHPLNTPVLDRKKKRVVRGHAVVQPRVGTLPTSSRRTRYSRFSSSPSGIDPYTTAVSDVYQDLFGEGSFVGKGIYDVDAFNAALGGRVPENRLLSHDLFEGIFARSALASDIEVLDEQPTSYEVAAARLHRWIRGDWQMVPWLFRVSHLRALDAWKILDNLRRSMLAPAIVLSCFVGFVVSPVVAAFVTGTLAAMFVTPVVARAVLSAARTRDPRAFVIGVGEDVASNVRQSFVQTIFLLDTALLALDAIVRTLHRLVISKRKLLEWTTMAKAERQNGRGRLRFWIGSALCAVVFVIVALHDPVALAFAVPVLALWGSAPAVAAYLREPAPRLTPTLLPSERKLLRLVARRTWRFFETFVGPKDNFLPPDNYQEDPRGVVAHRTSPTNMGLYLLSIVAARDFGFISLREVAERLDCTLSSIEKLDRREGHILNWYDTETLAPLEPQYVSTVDSGNLAAYLLTLREACEELAHASLVDRAIFDGLDDALALAREAGGPGEIDALRERLAEMRKRVSGSLADISVVKDAARLFDDFAVADTTAQVRFWIERARSLLRETENEIAALVPLSPTDERLARMRSAADVATIEGEGDAAAAFVQKLRMIGARAAAIADAMSFKFLFDEDRKLFSIGYNASAARLDANHYDLLASEARVASLLAIAKGDAPQEHWFRLARPRAAISKGQRVLLSWTGSMFEYLMPLLVTKSFPATLLDETYDSAVARQMDWGRESGVPWGVSESAYNLMDLAMTYQYRAFGVPGLGLKAGLGEDLVVAPYATALAALVRPRAAAANFRALQKMGVLGELGFYDAIDCTSGHVPPGRSSVVVKTYMAHHEGMTLVALDNALHGMPMQARFHRDLRVKSVELLLEERIPVRAPLVDAHASVLRTPVLSEPELDVVEHVGLGARPISRIHLLGHGQLSTAITILGEGFTTWRDVDVYRFREDASAEAGGLYLYFRDTKDDRVWSAGYKPTCAVPDFYDVAFAIDHVEITRRDGDVETLMEVVVSPERPAEVRRVTLTNHGSEAREIEVTTYTEVVLAPRAADIAHRAFAAMFVETEWVPERCALLAHRRPRSSSEPETWVAQVLCTDGDAWSKDAEHETSRASFVGRGRTTEDPAGLHRPLDGDTGSGLDPTLAIRRTVRLEPGAHARFTLTTALAQTREEALEVTEMFSTPHSIPRAFELAWADARVELKHLGVSAAQSHRFQRFLSVVLFPQASLRGTPDKSTFRGRGRGGLWAHGLTSDLPIVVVRIDHPDFNELLHEVILAHEFWRLNGVTVEVVVLNEEPPGYMQPQQEAIMSVVRSSAAATHVDQRGGVFVRRTRDLTEEELSLLIADARVLLSASRGSLARQMRKLSADALPRPRDIEPPRKPQKIVCEPAPTFTRAFDNGIGGFEDDGRTYAMTVSESRLPPMPWSNVMAGPHFGALVTESGSSFTWFANSQRHRLTPWSNDPVCDPSGETFFVRDEEDGSSWSPTPLPAGGAAEFVVRHGLGYTTFTHARCDLAHELIVFSSVTECVKTWRLRITNRGRRTRRLSIFGIAEWVLGSAREQSRTSIITDWDPAVPALLAQNPLSLHPERCAFFAASKTVASFSGDRDEVLGPFGARARPSALGRVALSGHVGCGLDPCAALQVPVTIEPGETAEVAFVLGEAESLEAARTFARKHRNADVIEHDLADVNALWQKSCGAITVKTPDPAIDALVNHWLLYQVTSCRLWGRSAFYQSGGAFGFRDQIQDVLALLHASPELAREHLLRSAARQFLEGDVQHWWHAGTGEGVRTRCSDDMLWLPYATATYVTTTGDAAVLDEKTTWLKERELTDNDEDVYSVPAITQEKGTLYEHCTRALDRGASLGKLGLPKMGSGDWNDGMNRVGNHGVGESVWLAWFLARTALDFAPVAEARGDHERAKWCRALAHDLGRAADEHAWDGAWYRRAFFDNGTTLGSKDNTECRIDAIAQSWSVIAGVGDQARARQAVRSSEDELVRPEDGLMRLLWPPFEKAEPDPGYIRAYPAGVRENGGQYTHGVLWTVMALAMLGEGDRATKLLSLLNPIHHGVAAKDVARYKVEPYVVAADVYEAKGQAGRGGWTWYTGSASWMYRVIVEHILGVRQRGKTLVIDPCIAQTWERFEVTVRDGAGEVHVVVENPNRVQRGKPQEFPLTGEPGRREVRVVVG